MALGEPSVIHPPKGLSRRWRACGRDAPSRRGRDRHLDGCQRQLLPEAFSVVGTHGRYLDIGPVAEDNTGDCDRVAVGACGGHDLKQLRTAREVKADVVSHRYCLGKRGAGGAPGDDEAPVRTARSRSLTWEGSASLGGVYSATLTSPTVTPVPVFVTTATIWCSPASGVSSGVNLIDPHPQCGAEDSLESPWHGVRS